MTLGRQKSLELHGERAAQRGNPSMVWRAGQNRRLDMILRWGRPTHRRHSWAMCWLTAAAWACMCMPCCRTAARCTGIDIEAEHLEIAPQSTCRKARYALALGEALPYADSSFDLVLSHEVLEHV